MVRTIVYRSAFCHILVKLNILEESWRAVFQERDSTDEPQQAAGRGPGRQIITRLDFLKELTAVNMISSCC